jgi:hypothetical protein
MTKIYFNIFIGIIILLWIIYFIQYFTKDKNEGFTPKIKSFYRPYIRRFNQNYENFISRYTPNILLNKLKKWNIY